MADIRNELLRTAEYPKSGQEKSELVYERSKIVGTAVKVMRTGQDEPDSGWYIADVYFRDAKKKINRTLIKVRKPDNSDSKKGLQKIVPLELLERINPEIKLMIFEIEKDYVLFEDTNNAYRIGLVVDIDFEDGCLTVLLDEGGEDITASQDRVKLTRILDKSDTPLVLEKEIQDRIKADQGA